MASATLGCSAQAWGKVGLKQTKKLSVSLKSLGSDGDSPDSAAGGTSLQHSGISNHHAAVAEVLSMAHRDDQDFCLVCFQVCPQGEPSGLCASATCKSCCLSDACI